MHSNVHGISVFGSTTAGFSKPISRKLDILTIFSVQLCSK